MNSPRTLVAGAMVLVLGACATKPPDPSYAVLLDNGDGTTGKILVSGSKGSTLIERAKDGVIIGAEPGQTFAASPEMITRDFGTAIAARPKSPSVFVLYFQAGGAVLTPESERALTTIAAEIAGRAAPDISITGHTDNTGDSEKNRQLGLVRATVVSGLLAGDKLAPDRVTIESHGDKNQLVTTGPNVDEPRNRRVEVTVR